MSKSSNLTAIMLVQQLEDEQWSLWTDKSTIHKARDGNCKPLLEEIVKQFNTDGIIVEEAYGIIHDKDIISVWNPTEKKNINEAKTKHIHFLFKFEKGASLQRLALAIKVEPQYLEKLKSGRYGYDNCQAYLVHAKDESKHQYSPDEVVTVLGEDYLSLYNRKMEAWLRGRAKKEAQETNLSVDWLISKILTGDLTKSQILLTDDYYKIYGQHKRKINEALETAGERKSFRTMAELEDGLFKKTIIFVHAKSGVGKTLFSKKLIRTIQAIALKYNQTWDYCITASNNPFDEYNGQDILFLDDIRGDSLSVSDWLKLLDPYMISPISARYHNKIASSRIIIITCTKKPNAFFSAITNNNEDLGQFIRRIDVLVSINGTFGISNPQKNEPIPQSRMMSSFDPRQYTYIFSKTKQYAENKALDKLIKTIIRNMQWNKQKKVTNASDQTNNDNLNSQQK